MARREHDETKAPEAIPPGVVPAPNPTPHLPKPNATRQPGTKLALASIMTADEPKVMVMVPTNIILTLDDHTQVTIKSGPQEIPARLANHWYLAACNVQRI